MSGKGPDLKRYMEKRLLIKARARVPNAASPVTPRPFAARGQAEARGHAPRLRPVHEPRRRGRHRAGLADREKRDRHRRHPRQLRRELRAHGARSADRPMHGQRHRLGAA
mmetsp:Transcript_15512/g.53780  ORF Transcript_15512/g.53780 Transcript_15512/m.53780 type:complete len:110 (+) Transcript_15512:160-489(+)